MRRLAVWAVSLVAAGVLLLLARRLASARRFTASPTLLALGADRCPLCFGTDYCPHLRDGLRFGCAGLAASLLALLGDRNVAFACPRAQPDQRIVLKSGALDLDERLCEPFGDDCERATPSAVLAASVALVAPERRRSDSFGLVVCPSPQALSHLIPEGALPLNVWTILNANPEPLVAGLRDESAALPVARYLGACGRTAVYADAGDRLALSCDGAQPLERRAKLAHGLLSAADALTFAHPRFALYLADVSVDNVCVLGDELTFVDVGDAVLVARDDVPGRSVHASAPPPCPGCFAFSVRELCTHTISDHNHFALCELILARLLPDSEKISPSLPALLAECVSPSVRDTPRFHAADAVRLQIAIALGMDSANSTVHYPMKPLTTVQL